MRALLDHLEPNSDALVATMIAEAGQPGCSPRARSWAWASRSAVTTIDLYLSMTHEETNPVPIDELVPGRVALSVRRHEPVGVVAAITPVQRGDHHGVPEADSRR